jgi:hypothetical protein
VTPGLFRLYIQYSGTSIFFRHRYVIDSINVTGLS